MVVVAELNALGGTNLPGGVDGGDVLLHLIERAERRWRQRGQVDDLLPEGQRILQRMLHVLDQVLGLATFRKDAHRLLAGHLHDIRRPLGRHAPDGRLKSDFGQELLHMLDRAA